MSTAINNFKRQLFQAFDPEDVSSMTRIDYMSFISKFCMNYCKKETQNNKFFKDEDEIRTFARRYMKEVQASDLPLSEIYDKLKHEALKIKVNYELEDEYTSSNMGLKIALMRAIDNNDTEGVEDLIKQGVNVQITKHAQYFPLIKAIEMRNADIVKQIVRAGANVNAMCTACHGNINPIFVAVKNVSPEMVQILLNAGADTSVKIKPEDMDEKMTVHEYLFKLKSYFSNPSCRNLGYFPRYVRNKANWEVVSDFNAISNMLHKNDTQKPKRLVNPKCEMINKENTHD